MFKQYKASDSELGIMEYIWSQDNSPSLRDITDYCNKVMGKNWKQQSIRVFLQRLADKGFINIFIDPETNRYVYEPIISRDEYLHNISSNLLSRFFNGSVTEFVSAFTGGDKLDKDDADKLKKFLNDEE